MMDKKVLVVYYSFSDSTRRLAEEIALVTDGDIRELIPEKAYSFGHNTAAKEVRREIEQGHCPRLLSGDEPVDDYDIIFLGTPNWFKSFAPPIRSFLRNADLTGKTIAPFCTHGGGGVGTIVQDISKECPHSALLAPFAAAGDFDCADVEAWIASLDC